MRKIFKYSLLSSVFATLLVAGTGCLKDELADEQQSIPDIAGSPSVVEIPGPVRVTNSYRTSYAISLLSGDKDTTFTLVPVRLAADQPAPEDIQVELEMVPQLLQAYNDSTHSNIEVPPANLYTLTSMTVAIPKGSREGALQVTTKPNNLVGPEYGFGVRIKSVSNPKYLISGNFNNAVILIGVRNKYDGDYELQVKTVGWAAYGISDNESLTYPENIAMVTASANSVALYNPVFAAGLVPAFTSTGDPTGFGAATPLFTFDPATDKLVSVVNTTPDDGRGRAFELNPAVTTSRFDPATRTIYAAYFLKQNGRPNMAIYDTLTYIGPRP